MEKRITRNTHLTTTAIKLRKDMTKEEKHLWYDYLHKLPIKFVRQKVIGNYVADFYCHDLKLIIELDGSQHYSEDAKIYDQERTIYFENIGIRVVRFQNIDINKNFEGVCLFLDNLLKNK
ncbi:MAG: endonuclease domain-containing protein [Clostridiales bacterium]|nr:endonuclease domain-containing protein [Clostridiales bacterium]